MTILNVTENLAAASFTGQETHNELTRGYDVITDGAETEDYDLISALIANGDIPNAGGGYASDTRYRARRVTCAQLTDPTRWIVTVTFDNRTVDYDPQSMDNKEVNTSGGQTTPTDSDDPEKDQVVFNISSKEETFPLYVDLAGNPVINTTGHTLDPLPMGNFYNDVYELEINSTDPTKFRAWNGTTNKDHIYIVDDQASPNYQIYCPPNTARVTIHTEGPLVRRKSDGTSVNYWKNRFSIERRNVWIPKSVFTSGQLEFWRMTAPETWNQFDTEWNVYTITIDGVNYYQIPFGELLANTSFYKLKSDAPSQWSAATDYEKGDRVYYTQGATTERYQAGRETGPGTSHGAEPPLIGGGWPWQKYADGVGGDRHERIRYKDVDAADNRDNAEDPVDTAVWVTAAGDVRFAGGSPPDPFVYLYFEPNLARNWLSAPSGFPATSAATTTTH